MNNEPNKPIPAQELTEKELEGVVGGFKQIQYNVAGGKGEYGAAESKEIVAELVN